MCSLPTHGRPRGTALLVEHCLVLGFAPKRPPARDRLEAELGHELTRCLVDALTRPCAAAGSV